MKCVQKCFQNELRNFNEIFRKNVVYVDTKSR